VKPVGEDNVSASRGHRVDLVKRVVAGVEARARLPSSLSTSFCR
jgi:hypothetical protein